jgi:hypothetical protein
VGVAQKQHGLNALGLDKRIRSPEHPVEVVVRADPNPRHPFAIPLADGAILLVDPNGPDVVVAGQLLEPK